MLRYVYFGTNSLEKAVAFYSTALAPLGMTRCVTGDPQWDRIAAGWGVYEDGGARELGFWVGKPFDGRPAAVGNGSMVAFTYAAYVRDPDGNKLAAVCRGFTTPRP